MVVAVPLVLVPALGLVQGGYGPDTWVWSGALAAWAAALAAVLSSDPGALRRAWPWPLAAAGLAAWTLLSATWSVRAAQSVLEARRAALYAAVVLALLVLARREGARLLAPATHAAISGLVLYALARYLFGTRHQGAFTGFLLSEPLGYANALGILSALGLLLALGVVVGPASRRHRALAAASAPLLALALSLTGSTASWLALLVGAAATALLHPASGRVLAAAAVLGPPAGAAAAVGWASRLAANVPDARLGGAAVAAAGAACAAAAAAAAALAPLPAGDRRARLPRTVVAGAVLLVAIVGAAAIAHAGAAEPRASYFHVAWHDQVVAHPALGTGAGTFGTYWANDGKPLELGGALDAHSLYLESLAELGPVGLLLVLALLLAPLRGLVRRRGADHVAAAAGAYAAFLVHAGLDWDWEMPAVVVAALACAAAVAAADLEPVRRPLGAAARTAVLVAGVVLGAASIAGARSDTVQSAAKAPPSGAFATRRG
ncbi:MAG TPA: hypothetical protein VFI10_01605 [Gaiellaceae bacterium]|jgi:hypothetical protein|nr:hypothetical protein [Gaiellaceae bacterium]